MKESYWEPEETEYLYESRYPFDYANCQPRSIYESCSAWSPMAGLIRELSNLTDIFYACNTRFPPLLLDTLKKFHPACRIHILPFNLRSLQTLRSDKYQLDLVQSPSLYSIRCSFRCPFSVDYTAPNRLNTAAIRTLTSMAPRLKEVYVAYAHGHVLYELDKAAWKGAEDLEQCFPQHRASLRTFHLGWHPGTFIEDGLLRDWSRFVDFDALRVLRLPAPLRPKGLELLGAYSFPFLKNLVINIDVAYGRDEPGYEREKTFSRFIDRLKKLCTLEVIGWDDFYLGKHLFNPSCGFALRTLDLQGHVGHPVWPLPNPFNARLIALTVQRWPLLENLAIRVRRSK
ncbi:hypothetical protein BDP81DRAFT_43817 [Colletotrichum phormii]|uniref:Uncharacterized protein n=1 Tax=Colletotrichum phormii TaxID=359342 RepID=A0AAI9ZN12_9PEZI|nr:uncharacterized protein BDP81DRAFT_43817 [Colletotrichum phormii]KAK1634985.1 hypothetical protein BDP81DRAFT_43817 [Colletotrichum phormii]